MSDLVGNPEDRFSQNEAQICFYGEDMKTVPRLSSNNEALEGGVPVSHIPLIFSKNIPYPSKKFGNYHQILESFISPYSKN